MIPIAHMAPVIQHALATGMIAFPIVFKAFLPKIWDHINDSR